MKIWASIINNLEEKLRTGEGNVETGAAEAGKHSLA